MSALKTISYNILQLLYPKLCASCNENLHANEHILCVNCYKNIPFTLPYYKENEMEKLLWGRFNFEYATSLLQFQKDSITQSLLHKLKYENRKDVGELLGKLLAKHLYKNKLIEENSVLIPIPLSKEKEFKRGFNQCKIICDSASKALQIPVVNDAVKRIKNTESQTRKTRIERLYNLQDAFAIDNIEQLENKNVILVDDVLTTGATIEACAVQILKNKTTTVSIASIAISTHF